MLNTFFRPELYRVLHGVELHVLSSLKQGAETFVDVSKHFQFSLFCNGKGTLILKKKHSKFQRVGSKGAILNDCFLIRNTRFRKKSRIATHCKLTFERYWIRIPNQTVQSRSTSHHIKPVLTWLWASDGTWPKKSHVIKAKKTMLIQMHEL